jgi:hypothetical protein
MDGEHCAGPEEKDKACNPVANLASNQHSQRRCGQQPSWLFGDDTCSHDATDIAEVHLVSSAADHASEGCGRQHVQSVEVLPGARYADGADCRVEPQSQWAGRAS